MMVNTINPNRGITNFHNITFVISILETKETLLWLSTVFTLGNHNFCDVIVSLTTLGLLKKTDNDFNSFSLGNNNSTL